MTAVRSRIAVAVVGTLAALLLLELVLRLVGGVFWWQQRRHNSRSVAAKQQPVVLCVGESTTAMGGDESYPALLQQLLNRQLKEPVTVINRGIPGGDSSTILDRLAGDLERYAPAVVVAMMGANDFAGPFPHDQLPEVQRSGFPYSLKTYKLARMLLFSAKRQHRAADIARPPTRHKAAPKGPSRSEKASEADLKKRLARRPDDYESVLALARLYERQWRQSEAEQTYARAVRIDGQGEAGQFGLGRMLRKQERYDAASRAFRRVTEINPENSNAFTSLGFCYHKLGDHRSARDAFESALALAPTERRIVIRALDFFEAQQDHSRVEALTRALEAGTVGPEIHGRLARYHQNRGDAGRADYHLRRARAARDVSDPVMTRHNYTVMQRMLSPRGVGLVAVQYPGRRLAPLKRLVSGLDGVHLVDNEQPFDRLTRQGKYSELFWDSCYGDFGHGTRRGNLLLAENVAAVLLRDVF